MILITNSENESEARIKTTRHFVFATTFPTTSPFLPGMSAHEIMFA